MKYHTKARDYELLEHIAKYFDSLASNQSSFNPSARSTREIEIRAEAFREAASDVRNIVIDGVEPPKVEAGE